MSSQQSPASEDRRAEIEKKIRHRVALEKKAFDLVKHLALTEAVTEDELIDIGQNITQEQYSDVTEERSIGKLCGYPLCSKLLENVLKQKFKISLINKAVYDLTERKKFCSSQCYEASKYFRSQILETPVWMREAENHKKLTILRRDENQKIFPRGRNGEIVFDSPSSHVTETLKSLKLADDDDGDNSSNVHKSSGARNNNAVEQNPERVDLLSEETSVVASVKQSKISVPDNARILAPEFGDYNKPVTERTSESPGTTKCLTISETVDVESKPHLTAPVEKVKSDCDQIKKHCAGQNKDKVIRSGSGSEQKTLSLTEKLQFICEWKSRRTVDFFHPTPGKDLSEYGQKVLQFYNGDSESKEEDSSTVRLVPVDNLSQSLQRRRIVLEKLSHVWPKLETLLQLTLYDCLDDLKLLVCTFDFSNKNILFKPPEWILVGYILFKILDEKKKCLYGHKLDLGPFCISEEQIARIVNFMTADDDMEMID